MKNSDIKRLKLYMDNAPQMDDKFQDEAMKAIENMNVKFIIEEVIPAIIACVEDRLKNCYDLHDERPAFYESVYKRQLKCYTDMLTRNLEEEKITIK